MIWDCAACTLRGGIAVNAFEVGGGFSLVNSYPSHFRPVEVQRLQFGFISSHLTRRILQVVQPVRTLGLLALFLVGCAAPETFVIC